MAPGLADSSFDRINNYGFFRVAEQPTEPPTARSKVRVRDSAGVALLEGIAAGLVKRGYLFGTIKQGKRITASCSYKPNGHCRIWLWLIALGSAEGFQEFVLMVNHFPPRRSWSDRLLGRNVLSCEESSCAETMVALCEVVGQEVMYVAKPAEVQWLTCREGDKRLGETAKTPAR